MTYNNLVNSASINWNIFKITFNSYWFPPSLNSETQFLSPFIFSYQYCFLNKFDNSFILPVYNWNIDCTTIILKCHFLERCLFNQPWQGTFKKQRFSYTYRAYRVIPNKVAYAWLTESKLERVKECSFLTEQESLQILWILRREELTKVIGSIHKIWERHLCGPSFQALG